MGNLKNGTSDWKQIESEAVITGYREECLKDAPMIMISVDKQGRLFVSSTHSTPECLRMLDQAKRHVYKCTYKTPTDEGEHVIS